MKRIIVPENNLAIVTNSLGVVTKYLTVGKHRLSWGERASIYDKSKDFYTNEDIDSLLLDTKFLNHVHVIEVAEGHIAMMYLNGVFTKVFNVGRHILWKNYKDYSFQIINTTTLEIQEDIALTILQKSIMAPYVRSYKIDPNEKGILYVDGKFEKVLDAGVYYWWANAIPVAVSKVDMRQSIMELSGQEILTKDKAQIRINFSVQYQVVDIEKVFLENKDYEKQLHNIMQLSLRGFIGQITLDELMENKAQVNEYVMTASQAQAQHLGVVILNCGLKDIILPGDMKDIMNQVLIAEKKAQANIIMRREETASTRSLLNTAKLMEENAMLMRLKEMEYVEKIADKINTISISGNGQIIDQLKQMFVK